MSDVRLGIRFRALRQRLGWRQRDLAERAGVSQTFVSLVERGHLESVPLRKLRRIADALEADVVTGLRWRGGDLDRLVDEGHAALVGLTVELLRSAGWEVRAEVSYSIFGERGSVDLLARREAAATLLVVEVKTELVSVEETLRKHDEKVRLAARIASEQLSWSAGAVGRLLVLPDLSTPRRRIERHAAVFGPAYPIRGLAVRRWLREPFGPMAGLIFMDPVKAVGERNTARIGRKRISGRGRVAGTAAT
jgi:transcriptional regulator with XRE-family HTH domain